MYRKMSLIKVAVWSQKKGLKSNLVEEQRFWVFTAPDRSIQLAQAQNISYANRQDKRVHIFPGHIQ